MTTDFIFNMVGIVSCNSSFIYSLFRRVHLKEINGPAGKNSFSRLWRLV